MIRLLLWMVNWILHTKMYERVASTLMAKYTFRRFGWPKFCMSNYFHFRQLVMPDPYYAYIFVSADKSVLNYKINRLVTDCVYGHAGFVSYHYDGEPRIKHMVSNGLESDYLINLLHEVDDFALLAFQLKDYASTLIFKQRLARFDELGPDYDFAMDNPDKFYCSEYVYRLLYGLTRNPIETMLVNGTEYVTPDAIYSAADRVVFEERHK